MVGEKFVILLEDGIFGEGFDDDGVRGNSMLGVEGGTVAEQGGVLRGKGEK